MTLRCGLGHHYMVEVESYGLLYKWDARTQVETDGTFMCETIAGRNTAGEPVRLLSEEGAAPETTSAGTDTSNLPVAETTGEAGSTPSAPEEEPAAVEEVVIPRVSQNVTEWNLDTLCQSNSKYLYADDEAKATVDDYFRENCFQKEACRLDLDDIGGRRFRDLLSPFCRRRVLGDPEAET